MNYWLFKSEPSCWSWDDQVKSGKKGTSWDGVRNYQARNNMKMMKKGDLGFFYHSVKERNVVGIVEVIKEAYRDRTAEEGDDRWAMVDVAMVETLDRPVNLSEIKEHPALENMQLIKQSRLSVCPVSAKEFKIIRELGVFN